MRGGMTDKLIDNVDQTINSACDEGKTREEIARAAIVAVLSGLRDEVFGEPIVYHSLAREDIDALLAEIERQHG